MKAIERLFLFLDHSNLKHTPVEKDLGLTNGYLGKMRDKKGSVGSDILEKILCKFPQLSSDWLITGTGPMLRDEAAGNPTETTEDHLFSIPIVDISAAAGIGGCENSDYLEVIDTIKIPNHMIKRNKTYYCLYANGDSMAPTIQDKSYIIVRRVEQQEWCDVQDKRVYVVTDRNGKTYVKRLINNFKSQGIITCMSDNPDKMLYADFTLQEEEIHNLFYVEWCISSQLSNAYEKYYGNTGRIDGLENQMDEVQRQIGQILKVINIK